MTFQPNFSMFFHLFFNAVIIYIFLHKPILITLRIDACTLQSMQNKSSKRLAIESNYHF